MIVWTWTPVPPSTRSIVLAPLFPLGTASCIHESACGVKVSVDGAMVGLGVGVKVAPPVAVGVGADGPAGSIVNTSSGRLAAFSRELNSTPSVDSPASTKLRTPKVFTSDVTLYSTHAPDGIVALLSAPPLMRAVRLFQLMPVSVQLLPAA